MGPAKMKYQIYIGEGCHDCDEVLDWLRANKIKATVIDLDQSKEEPPIPVFARPALFENQELKAYGLDIIEYLKKS